MNNWSCKLQGIIVTFCFNQFPSGVGESALKGKKAAAKKGRDGESGCWWKWTLCLQSLHWHLLQLKTSFIQRQKWLFPLPLLRFSVNLTHRGHFIYSHPIDPHVSDMISLSLMSQFVESFRAIVSCLLCLCAAYVWACNWFICQWFQKAAFITRKSMATCKNGGDARCYCAPRRVGVLTNHYQTAK